MRNICYFLLVLFTVSLIVACQDDDQPIIEEETYPPLDETPYTLSYGNLPEPDFQFPPPKMTPGLTITTGTPS